MFGHSTGFDPEFFAPLERMRQEMDQLFGTGSVGPGIRAVTAGTFPPLNMGVSPEQIDVYAFSAGIDPKSLEITLQQNLLSISGERRISYPEGVQLYRRERFDGKFRRVLSLPEDVDPDQVEAKYQDGVLRITVQRREAVKPRQIQVH
jgi:HSP20 family protein